MVSMRWAFATIDTDRLHRTGLPEMIYAAGKSTDQVRKSAERMYQNGIDVSGKSVPPEMSAAIKEVTPMAEYNEMARIVALWHQKVQNPKGYIAVVAAGTSDMPVVRGGSRKRPVFLVTR